MSPPQKFSVLVLDNVSAVGATLAASGFAVTEVPTGEEAMRQRPFDLVLLYMNVSGWNSLEACRQVRAFAPNTKIIMMAPVDADEDRVRALEAGADDCVNKPLELRELIARARAVLRLSSPEIIRPLEVSRPAKGKSFRKARSGGFGREGHAARCDSGSVA